MVALEIGAAEMYTGIDQRPQSISRQARTMYILQLANQPWTTVIYAIGSIPWHYFREVESRAKALAADNGWIAIYAWETDSGENGTFQIYEGAGASNVVKKDILRVEKIRTPGVKPHSSGIEIFGVLTEELHRVDVLVLAIPRAPHG